MKIKLLILVLLSSFTAFAQYDSTKQLQVVNAYGNDVKNIQVRGSLILPRDTFKLAVKDSGSIAYKANSVWSWNGYVWNKEGGSGGAGITVTYYGLNATNDSTILLLSNNVRYAVVLGTTATINTNYSNLLSLIGTNNLIEGRNYRIVDFATTYKLLTTNETARDSTGDVEPLIVHAQSNNKLAVEAFSELYPEDIIHYSIYDTSPLAPLGSTLGKIIFRHDTKNNLSTFYDFRAIVWQRCEVTSGGPFLAFFNNTGVYTFVKTFGSNNKDISLGEGSINATFSSSCYDITVGKRLGGPGTGLFVGGSCHSINIASDCAAVQTVGSGYIGGIYIGSSSRNINIGSRSYNIAIGQNNYAIELGLQNSDISIPPNLIRKRLEKGYSNFEVSAPITAKKLDLINITTAALPPFLFNSANYCGIVKVSGAAVDTLDNLTALTTSVTVQDIRIQPDSGVKILIRDTAFTSTAGKSFVLGLNLLLDGSKGEYAQFHKNIINGQTAQPVYFYLSYTNKIGAGGGSGGDTNLQQVTDVGNVTTKKITVANLKVDSIPEYENNAAALADSLQVGSFYRLPYNDGNIRIAQVNIPTFSRITIVGQSNALGVGTVEEIETAIKTSFNFLSEFNRVFIWDTLSGSYQRLLAGVNNIGAIIEYPLFGPELGIAYRWIKEHPLGNLYINKFAGDGQPIANFQVGTTVYTRGLNIYTSSNVWLSARNISPTDDAFVWVQGESDAGNTENYYRTQLNTLFASYISDGIIKSYTKQIITQIASDGAFYTANIANAKISYVAATTNAILVTYPSYYRSDRVHLNTQGQLQLAYDVYQNIYSTSYLAANLKPSNFPNNAVAFWNFEQASGNFTSSIGTYPLVRTGATTITGKIGNAVNFANNAGQFLTGSNSSAFSITDSGFTITGWAKVASGTGSTFICGKGTIASNFEYGLYVENGALYMKVNDGSSIFTSYGQTVPIGSYFFFCFRYASNSPHYELMVNTQYSTALNTPTYFTGAGTFTVGKDLTATGLDLGTSVDLLRVFPRYIQDMEVAQLYNFGNGQ